MSPLRGCTATWWGARREYRYGTPTELGDGRCEGGAHVRWKSNLSVGGREFLGPFHSSCLAYMDLNMVRAGVVAHSEEWPECGYVEIQHPKARYGIIDYECLMD